jgi:hypothetical protein
MQTPPVPALGTALVELPSSLPLIPTTAPLDATGLGLIPAEILQLGWLEWANSYRIAGSIANAVAAVAFLAGALNPVRELQAAGHAGNAVAHVLNALADNASSQAGREALLAGHQRRRDDWVFQANSAAHDIQQIDNQIAAATIRQTIAQKELDNHREQVKNAEQVDEFLRSKFTNEQLYTWMSRRLSGIYHSAYELALETARHAQRAYRYELAQPDATFVEPRYWDSERQGLLAGERLAVDIKRMDTAYLAANRRELELTRQVSLLRLDPTALVRLRHSGRCEFAVPETLFDIDAPGCYLRRLKSVSLSIPCVVGRYSSVHARLTLLRSSTRNRADITPGQGAADNYPRSGPEDRRFTDDFAAIESIVTSGSIDASGLWEVSLRDERRLPFEGRGAISTWQLELPPTLRSFDYATISDVILTIRYAARHGGDALRDAASAAAMAEISRRELGRWPQQLLVSLRHDFPTEWARLAAGAGQETQEFAIGRDRFPYLFTGLDITVRTVDAFTVVPEDEDPPTVSTPGARALTWAPIAPRQGASLRHASVANLSLSAEGTTTWTVRPSDGALPHDLVLILTYTAQEQETS